MSIWIIEPYDPLIFRDGRPFGKFPGVTAKSLPAPFPSTIAGGFRSQAATLDGAFQFTNQDQDKLRTLKELAVRGPILVQLSRVDRSIEKWLVPAPVDALLLEAKTTATKQGTNGESVNDKNAATKQGANDEHKTDNDKLINVHRLLPLKPLEGAVNDLQRERSELYLVGTIVYHSEKPPKEGAPNYWYYDQFLKWLKSSDEKDLWTGPIVSGQLGHNGPVYEERVHVAIKAESHTGKDGLLFATSGLEFTAAIPPATSEQSDNPSDDREKKHSLTTTRQLALAIIIDDVPDPDDTVSQQVQQLKLPLQPGPNTLGGEQRLVHWNKHQQAETILECPKEIEQTIKDKGACRLILLTPAYFSHGNIPTWLQKERDGVTPRLQAIVNQRPQVVSGWDIANKKPKASSRLLPAGSVLFLTLDGDEVARAAWIKSIWLHCISDDIPKDESVSPKQGQQANLAEHPDQYRRDGFGLAVLGIWSGKPCSLDLTSLEKKGTAQ